MLNTALASLAFECADMVGDTSTAFMTKCQRFLNNRYEDALLRIGATMWTGASLAGLGGSDIPLLGLGRVIREGATADAWQTKRQFQKSGLFEAKYEKELAQYICSKDPQLFNISMARYEDY